MPALRWASILAALLLLDLSSGGQLSYDVRIFKTRCCRGGDCSWNQLREDECPAGWEDRPDPGMHCPADLRACQALRQGTNLLMDGMASASDDALRALTESRDTLPPGLAGPSSAARCNLAVVLLLRSRGVDALRPAHRLLTSAVLLDGSNDAAVANLGIVGGAAACADWAAQEPDGDAYCEEIQDYHNRMLHDAARNEAYARAIRAALKLRPGANVVDIGAGSGLLSILAAQAGASSVTAYEMVRPFAALAAVHARWNNVSARVRVVAGKSSAGGGGGGPLADVVVHEIFDPAMLGEGVVDSLRHAVAELAKPGALLVPARSVAHVHFVSSRTLSSHKWPPRSPNRYGVDYAVVEALSGGMFGSRHAPIMELHTIPDAYQVTRRTAVLELDFARLPDALEGQRWTAAQVISQGEINAAVLSFDAVFESGEVLSTFEEGSQGTPPTHWGQQVFLLGNRVHVWPGDTVNFLTQWDSMGVWPVRYEVQRGSIGKRRVQESGDSPGWTPPEALETDLSSQCLDVPSWIPAREQAPDDVARGRQDGEWGAWSSWDIVWGADGQGPRPDQRRDENIRRWARRMKRLFELGKETEAWEELVREGERSRPHAAAWHAIACSEMIGARSVERGLEHGQIAVDIALASDEEADIVIENLMAAASLLLLNGDVGAASGLLQRAPQLALRASYFDAMACTMVITAMASAVSDTLEAEGPLRAALDTLPAKHAFRTNPLSNLALLRHAQGRKAEAMSLLGEALLCDGDHTFKRTASRNLQLLAKGTADTQALSNSLKYINTAAWMSAFNASISYATSLKQACSTDKDASAGSSCRPGAVRDSLLVVDAGTGTGTLSVMASRAGATRVVSCAEKEWSTPMTQATVGLSGFGRVLDFVGQCTSSGKGDALQKLGRPADIIVHDLVGTPANFVRGTGALDAIADVVRRLGDKFTVVVPSRVELLATVANSPTVWKYRSAPDTVLGCNVSLWRAVTNPSHPLEVQSTSTMIPSYPLAPPKAAMVWDFKDSYFLFPEEPESEQRVTVELEVSVTGHAHCVVLSVALGFPGGGRYVDDPEDPLNPDVGRTFLILPREEWLRRGDVVSLTLARDADGVIFIETVRVSRPGPAGGPEG